MNSPSVRKRHFGALESALLKACRAGRVDDARHLLDQGADPLALHPDLKAHCRTPFGACAARDDESFDRLACLRLLMPRFDWKAEAALDSRGAFSLFARANFLEGLAMLFQATPAPHQGALRVRCARDALKPLVCWTMLQGCGPNDADSQSGALALACSKGMLDHARRLIEDGADPRALDSCGADCLWLAARAGHVDLCQLLRERCDPNAPGPNGLTPLMAAIRAGQRETVAALLPISDLSIRGPHGEHALALAMRSPYAFDPQPWAELRGDFALLDLPGSDAITPRQAGAKSVGRAHFFQAVQAGWEANAMRQDLPRAAPAQPKAL